MKGVPPAFSGFASGGRGPGAKECGQLLELPARHQDFQTYQLKEVNFLKNLKGWESISKFPRKEHRPDDSSLMGPVLIFSPVNHELTDLCCFKLLCGSIVTAAAENASSSRHFQRRQGALPVQAGLPEATLSPSVGGAGDSWFAGITWLPKPQKWVRWASNPRRRWYPRCCRTKHKEQSTENFLQWPTCFLSLASNTVTTRHTRPLSIWNGTSMWKDLNLLSHFVLFSLHLTSILRLRVGWGSRVGQSRSGEPGGVGNPPSTSAPREASRCCRCCPSEPPGARGARGGTHGKGPRRRGHLLSDCRPLSQGLNSQHSEWGLGKPLCSWPLRGDVHRSHLQGGTQDTTREWREDLERRNGSHEAPPQAITDFPNTRTAPVLGKQSITKGNRLTFVKNRKQSPDCSISARPYRWPVGTGADCGLPSPRASSLTVWKLQPTPQPGRTGGPWPLTLYPEHGPSLYLSP